ncbi:MAG: hypothetical protein JSV29_07005 [Candidatus Bathyarchaeota archaeon]|nr:MAG: hypothetical protein JSV29_07005 [Candidatus Bathyarchaeota archaeon]
MKKRIVVAVLVVLVALIASLLVWFVYRYDTTVLSLSYEANPITSSPLSGANYSWEAKAYSARIFGNSPFNGKGYVQREKVTSENRFQNIEFHNLNVSLRLRFQITNATGFVLCNKTIYITDGCDRQVTFEFKPEGAKAGNTLQIRVTLSLGVNYNYGVGGEPKQFTLQKEWTKTIQVRQTEPKTGVAL